MQYAELHCTTNFSFHCGGSHPDELVATAHSLGYEALAITDHATLAGIVRAHSASKQIGLKIIIGTMIEVIDSIPIVVWVMNQAGYSNLSRLLTLGYQQAVHERMKDKSLHGSSVTDSESCRLTLDDVATYSDGLLAGVPLASFFASCQHEVLSNSFVVDRLAEWRNIFWGRLYTIAEVARAGDDKDRLRWFQEVAEQAYTPLVVAGDVRYHVRSRMPLFDALTAVRCGCTVEEARAQLLSNGERHLQDKHQIFEQFAEVTEAIERSIEIASRCTFSLDEIQYEYPKAVVPECRTAQEQLVHLAWKGASQRYPKGIPESVCQLINHELSLIAELGYESYFLTVFDIVRFARRRGILCQGRGSAANSAVCYCLGITSVDPTRMKVLFERFVSRERQEAPDIDVDFEHHRREEVIQYIYKTYGRTRAAMTAEIICYRLRSAVRDLAKALGMSRDRIDAIASTIDVGDSVDNLPARLSEAGVDPVSDVGVRLVSLVNQLVGFPRHLGQHVGGMVITQGALCDLVPIQPAAMEGRTIIQWDKNDLDELGILKVDCLALGMLSCIRRAFDLIESFEGKKLTLATVPAEDPAVYEMVSRADTVGVFQIESRAQMSMLPRLRPACFYDLVIEVAIVRPGPIQGNMVHPYLRRRNSEEPVTYPNEELREVLEKTLGVPIFQEQAMRLAVVAAGFSPGEADQLRRAMGAWRRPGIIEEFRQKLISGMLQRGLSQQFADQVFGQIRGFGEYGFPESHAASFALLVYVSAWIKRHHPAAFTAALLASQPMGFYAPSQLVHDVKAHGVKVLPVDINDSQWHATLERYGRHENHIAVRLGFEQIYGLGESTGIRIETARIDGRFQSVREFAHRAELHREALLCLARAGALESLGLERRKAIWEAMQLFDHPGRMPLLDQLGETEDDDNESMMSYIDDTGTHSCSEYRWDHKVILGKKYLEKQRHYLPSMSQKEQVIADYQTMGLSLVAHPLQFEREHCDSKGIIPIAKLPRVTEGSAVCIMGITVTRQRPATASGIIFLTIEDETGTANIVVHPRVWGRSGAAARRASVLVVHGCAQHRDGVIHVVASRLEANRIQGLPKMSRDFC